MGKFEFKDRYIPLEIGDDTFQLNITKFPTRANDASTEMLERSKKEEDVKAKDLFENMLNVILEDECAYEKIYKNRTFDALDAIELLNWIKSEVVAFRSAEWDRATKANTPTSNRAQRRQKKQ